MAGPATPWGSRVVEILDDGRWHLLDQVISDAAKLVPPGVAYRRGERMRQHLSGAQARRVGTNETAIRSGARNKVYEAVMIRVYRGTILKRVSRTGVIRIRSRRRSTVRRAA